MKKYLILIALTFCVGQVGRSQATIFSTGSGNTTFFSKTPVEDIQAENKKSQVILNTATGEIAVKVNMRDFVFENKLMQEHFNENYMESARYPSGTFSGKLDQPIDFSKTGEFDVSATGKFTVHGVTQAKTLKGKLKTDSGNITITADFTVALEDHKIDVPEIVFVKIARTIQVKANYSLARKK